MTSTAILRLESFPSFPLGAVAENLSKGLTKMIVGVCGVSSVEKYNFARLLAKELGYSFLHFQNRTNVLDDVIEDYFCSDNSPIFEFSAFLDGMSDNTVVDFTPLDLLAELMSEISSHYVNRFEREHEEGGQELLGHFCILEQALLRKSEIGFSYFVHIRQDVSQSDNSWSNLRISHIDHLVSGYLSRLKVDSFYLSSKRMLQAKEYVQAVIETFRKRNQEIMNNRIQENIVLH